MRKITGGTSTTTPSGEDKFYPGVYTATSRHRDAVIVLIGDGSTRQINDLIDNAVWFGIGTRAGSENVQLPRSR